MIRETLDKRDHDLRAQLADFLKTWAITTRCAQLTSHDFRVYFSNSFGGGLSLQPGLDKLIYTPEGGDEDGPFQPTQYNHEGLEVEVITDLSLNLANAVKEFKEAVEDAAEKRDAATLRITVAIEDLGEL